MTLLIALLWALPLLQARETPDAVELTARDGREFESRVVIAADGVHSTVARRLGLNPGWPASSVALDMMEETPRSALRDIDPSTLWVSYGHQPAGHQPPGGAAAEGYAYIFPKRDHVNVGIGYLLSYYRESMDESPYDLQREFVDGLRRRRLVEGESVRDNFTPFLIPVGGPLRKPARGSVLLAGDAGGFVNAFTAEGIYYAMVSGDLAARAIVDDAASWSGWKLADRYRRTCQAEIGAELRDSVWIQRFLFSDPRRIARMIRAAPHQPAITQLILDYAMGRRPYRSVRRRLLARSPGLALHLMVEILKSIARREVRR